MPKRPRPLTPAERMRAYRQRQREGRLYASGTEVPLRLAERLIETGALDQQKAADRRALAAALIAASWRYVEIEENRNVAVTHKSLRVG